MLYKTQLTNEMLLQKCPSIFSETVKTSLSEKYLYIPTFKILDGLTNNGFKVVGAKEQRSRVNNRDHAKHVVFLTHDSISDLQVNEGLPMIRVENSHNGLSSFQLTSGFFRLVCSNGLILPESELSAAKIKHVKGMENDVIEASYKILTSMPEQIKMINTMKGIELNRDERMILAESATNLIFDQEIIDLNKSKNISIADKLLSARRYEDKKNDLWSTFNVIQENAIKGGFRVLRESGYRKTKSVTGIDSDKKINVELMMLAEKMMQLKMSA